MWPYYPDPSPNERGGTSWPPALAYQRFEDPTDDDGDGDYEAKGVGIPLAVGIEVTASNDARNYADALKAYEEGVGPQPTQAVATVKQTVWLTPKWMAP